MFISHHAVHIELMKSVDFGDKLNVKLNIYGNLSQRCT